MEQKGERVIIVDGEAPESSSDEDIEIESFNIPVSLAREASESNVSSITSGTQYSLGNEFPSPYHKKLYQKNEDLWNHMSSLLCDTVQTSSKNLIATDKLLLNSQITLQSVSKATKKVNVTMDLVVQKVETSVFTGNFLPRITFPSKVGGGSQ